MCSEGVSRSILSTGTKGLHEPHHQPHEALPAVGLCLKRKILNRKVVQSKAAKS